MTMILSVFVIFLAIFKINSLKACGLHGFQLCGVASIATDITAVVDAHAPNVALLSAVAGNPAAVWVHDVPVISAVDLLLSSVDPDVSDILSSGSQCFTVMFFLQPHK